MDKTFHKIDIGSWERKDAYEFFTSGGCGFSMTANIDITGLYAFAKKNEIKLYPLLVAATIRIMNTHKEFRCGRDEDDNFGYYDVVHPLFFDLMSNGSTRSLFAEYKSDLLEQVAELEQVREAYSNINSYIPQGSRPRNLINISCVPWVQFTGMSFCLKYCATYYAPIITFGKYEKRDGRVIIPLSVYCNHAVNDGYHCSLMFSELEEISAEIG